MKIAAAALALLLALPALAQDAEYRLGPKDLLSIQFLEIPELNAERRVSDTGAIDLPVFGEISVAGLTAAGVREKLEALARSKYLNRANVSVVIKEFANKPVSIVGAVEHPGSLNVSARWFLLQAISAAGGLSDRAGKKIYILRHAENGLTDTLEIKRDDLFRSSSSKWNVPIFPSDIVNVPARSTVKVFCLGEVKQPGALEFDSDDRISLLSVVAKAGGLTDRASKTIRIKRRGADGVDHEIVANYNRIVAGKEPDPPLQGDDVVVVKLSFF